MNHSRHFAGQNSRHNRSWEWEDEQDEGEYRRERGRKSGSQRRSGYLRKQAERDRDRRRDFH